MKHIEKIKYLIIFTLILSLGILYTQLANYKNLTNALILENNKLTIQNNKNQKEILSNKNLIQQKEIIIKQLNNNIITLDENILKLTIKKDNQLNNFSTDKLSTQELTYIPPAVNTTNLDLDTNIIPSIEVSDQNKITGFNLQYQQKF